MGQNIGYHMWMAPKMLQDSADSARLCKTLQYLKDSVNIYLITIFVDSKVERFGNRINFTFDNDFLINVTIFAFVASECYSLVV